MSTKYILFILNLFCEHKIKYTYFFKVVTSIICEFMVTQSEQVSDNVLLPMLISFTACISMVIVMIILWLYNGVISILAEKNSPVCVKTIYWSVNHT